MSDLSKPITTAKAFTTVVIALSIDGKQKYVGLI